MANETSDPNDSSSATDLRVRVNERFLQLAAANELISEDVVQALKVALASGDLDRKKIIEILQAMKSDG